MISLREKAGAAIRARASKLLGMPRLGNLATHASYKLSGEMSRIRLVQVLRDRRISLVLDVGANEGQFALGLRRRGYEGRIVSIEPLTGPFERLSQACRADPRWDCQRIALGSSRQRSTLWVANNKGQSSSILEMKKRHEAAAPDAAYVGKEEIEVESLDDAAPAWVPAERPLCLKLDTQGYEMEILRGAERTLEVTDVVYAELLAAELYEAQAQVHEVIEFLTTRGFELVDVSPDFLEPGTNFMLGLNGLFVRRPASERK